MCLESDNSNWTKPTVGTILMWHFAISSETKQKNYNNKNKHKKKPKQTLSLLQGKAKNIRIILPA